METEYERILFKHSQKRKVHLCEDWAACEKSSTVFVALHGYLLGQSSVFDSMGCWEAEAEAYFLASVLRVRQHDLESKEAA